MSWQNYACCNKYLSWQTRLSWKTHVCHDKTFVATKMILVPAPTNDRGRAHNYGLFQVQRYRLELKWPALRRSLCSQCCANCTLTYLPIGDRFVEKRDAFVLPSHHLHDMTHGVCRPRVAGVDLQTLTAITHKSTQIMAMLCVPAENQGREIKGEHYTTHWTHENITHPWKHYTHMKALRTHENTTHTGRNKY